MSKYTNFTYIPEVFLAATARSGINTFRKTLEQITGITTGSVLSHFYPNNTLMLSHGFKGEDKLFQTLLMKINVVIQDDRVMMLKFPYPHLTFRHIMVKRIIVPARDPIQTTISQLHFYCTYSQNINAKNDFQTEMTNEFKQYFEAAIMRWYYFYKFWVEFRVKNQIPVYFAKYEDLDGDKKFETYKQVLQFCFAISDFEGTYLEERLNKVLASYNVGVAYVRRQKLGMELKEEYVKFVLNNCKDLLLYFEFLNDEIGEYHRVKYEAEEESKVLKRNYRKDNYDMLANISLFPNEYLEFDASIQPEGILKIASMDGIAKALIKKAVLDL